MSPTSQSNKSNLRNYLKTVPLFNPVHHFEVANKPACMQLPLTWSAGTAHHNKLLHPCRMGKKRTLGQQKRRKAE